MDVFQVPMKKKNLKYLIFAAILLAAFCGLISATLSDREPYAPENEVENMNYERSQVYVDGTGYKLDSYKKKEHKEEEVKHRQIIQKKPEIRRPVVRRTPVRRYIRPARRITPRRTTPRKTTPTKPKKKEESKKEDKKEKISENPVININIKNGAKVTGTTKKFTVTATTYDGDPIEARNITVKMNGTRLLEEGDNTYVGDVKDGKNTITVTATDSKGRKSKLTRTFTGKTSEPPKVIGNLSVVITAEALGIDTVVPKKKVKVYENERLSDVVKRYLSENEDIKGENIGTGYYELGRVYKDGIIDEIPEDKIQELEDMGMSLPDDRDSLGLNDFGAGSGWMYDVDGTSPGQYMSKMDPVVDSEVEIFYTVSGM